MSGLANAAVETQGMGVDDLWQPMAFESFAEIRKVVPGGPVSVFRRDEFNQFNHTSATAKACATNWSGKNNRVAPKQRHGLAPQPARAPASHPAHPAIDPPGACLDPPTRSLARFHRPPEASLAHKISLVFHTDLADCYRAGTHGIYSAQRKAHPPLGAGAEVDHGVEVVVAKNHRTRTAPSGWMVRPVRFYFYFGICSSFNIVNPE